MRRRAGRSARSTLDQEEGEARPARAARCARPCGSGLNVKANILDRLSRRATDGSARDAALRPAHGAHRRARRLGVDVLAVPRLRAVRAACAPPGASRGSTTTTTRRCSRTPTSPARSRTPTRLDSDAAAALPAGGLAAVLRRELPHPSGAPAALALQHRRRAATSRAWRCRSAISCAGCRRRAGPGRGGVDARHLRHLRPRASRDRGAVGLGAAGRATSRRWCTRRGRSRRAPGPILALLARLLDPQPEETAERIVATRPDVVAFTSYSVTHRWSVEVARAVKRRCDVPIVFGGPHVVGGAGARRSASGRSTPSSKARARARWST